MLAAVALPGTNGFIGEFLCLLGAYQATQGGSIAPFWVVLGATGTVLAAVYMLWMFQRVFYGPVPERLRSVRDLTVAEVMLVIPLMVLIFWIGLRPIHFTLPIEHAAKAHATTVWAPTPALPTREASQTPMFDLPSLAFIPIAQPNFTKTRAFDNPLLQVPPACRGEPNECAMHGSPYEAGRTNPMHGSPCEAGRTNPMHGSPREAGGT
jgi:NADH:ubiquinone oxidoreductase subunit 5 (subunit L)/multisubunit Na+/H+ antiporter MnhA subunit